MSTEEVQQHTNILCTCAKKTPDDPDDLFSYKTMSVAFRVALDELLDDYSKYIADPAVKAAVIRILMLRVKKAEKYINMELAKRAQEEIDAEKLDL